jgi:nitroreductase
MSNPSLRLTRELVQTACLAPSVNNTQPWSWRLPDDDVVELYADRDRQLVAADPAGRDLVLSCGAALHHLLVAARAFGVNADATEFPRPDEPDLLAVVRLSPGEVTDEGPELLAALENRRTDRRGSSDWPVPAERLERMAHDVSGTGVRVVVLSDRAEALRAEELIAAAHGRQRVDPAVAEEQDAWVERGGEDGVPSRVAVPPGAGGPNRPPSRYARREHPRDPRGEHGDVLVAIGTVDDDAAAWLGAGSALSALWLEATRAGMALTPTTEVVELDATRRLLRREVLHDALYPQVVARIGWPAAAHAPAPSTPRRPLEDVIRD